MTPEEADDDAPKEKTEAAAPIEEDEEAAPIEEDEEAAPIAEAAAAKEEAEAAKEKAEAAARKRENRDKNFLRGMIIAGFFFFIGVSILFDYLGTRHPIDIVARAEKDPAGLWTARGQALHHDLPLDEATVTVILRGSAGQRFYSDQATTEKNGSFTVTGLPVSAGGNVATGMIFNARKTITKNGEIVEELAGTSYLELDGGKVVRPIRVRWASILIIPILMIISLLVPFSTGSPETKYHALIILVLAFTSAMFLVIMYGLWHVKSTARPGECLSLGPAIIFHASYVDKQQPEWILSFTEPTDQNAATDQNGKIKGLGAPLWVLLFSVFGSGLFTIRLVIQDITDRPKFEVIKGNDVEASKAAQRELRQRMSEMIGHQMYILFAPVSAILVYQLLLMGNAANEPVTVAFAAVGAGASLDALLTRSIGASSQVIS